MRLKSSQIEQFVQQLLQVNNKENKSSGFIVPLWAWSTGYQWISSQRTSIAESVFVIMTPP